MTIAEKELRHWINSFYGYGSWQANTWFIDHEESGGEIPETVMEKINYFYKVHTATGPALCDIRELYRHITVRPGEPKAHLFTNHYEYWFGSNAVQNTVWKNLLAFQNGYRAEKLPDFLEYQQYTFASPSAGRETLIRLYPLPGPRSHAWYYSWLDLPELNFLKSRRLYEEYVYEYRIHTILSNIREYKPEVVLMYGMDNINKLKKSIQQFFPEHPFKMVKATQRQIPLHHRIGIHGTTLLITTQIPALKHKRIETGFDWEEFGKAVKSST